jgi:hypothetical protein
MSVRNVTRGTVLAGKLLRPSSLFSDALHHLGTEGIPHDCALWISPCDAVYTVGMNKPVDVVFLDEGQRIVKVIRNFPPNCYAESEEHAVSALELPPNKLSETGTDTGDVLELEDD